MTPAAREEKFREYRRLILNELERLNKCSDELDDKYNSLRLLIEQKAAKKHRGLENSVGKVEERCRRLEGKVIALRTSAKVWGAILGAIVGFLPGIVSFLYSHWK